MNMFKPTKAKSVEGYLDSVPVGQRETVLFLHEFIQKTVPKLKPHFASNMLGYGSFPYKNYKKESIEWPVIAMAYRANYISVYVCCITKDGQYAAESYKKELGKVKVGRSCINIKKIEDVNLPVLKKVLKEAEKRPGLVPIK
jgi:Domain of unknown function (DU1801)